MYDQTVTIVKCLGIFAGYLSEGFCCLQPLVMHLACVNFRMSMTEALYASTINAAASLGKSAQHGSLEIGKKGDMIIIGANRCEQLYCYIDLKVIELIRFVLSGGNT